MLVTGCRRRPRSLYVEHPVYSRWKPSWAGGDGPLGRYDVLTDPAPSLSPELRVDGERGTERLYAAAWCSPERVGGHHAPGAPDAPTPPRWRWCGRGGARQTAWRRRRVIPGEDEMSRSKGVRFCCHP